MTAIALANGLGVLVNPGSSNAMGLTPQVYLKKVSRPAHHNPLLLPEHTAKRDIQRLATLEEDWDGFGSDKPRNEAISHAIAALPALIAMAEKTGGWSLPHVVANEVGEVVLEWWKGGKKLTLFVQDERIDFLRTWGERIDSDMEDGILEPGEFAALWTWLNV